PVFTDYAFDSLFECAFVNWFRLLTESHPLDLGETCDVIDGQGYDILRAGDMPQNGCLSCDSADRICFGRKTFEFFLVSCQPQNRTFVVSTEWIFSKCNPAVD